MTLAAADALMGVFGYRRAQLDDAITERIEHRKPTVRLDDYYVRPLRTEGTDRRGVVVYEVIGTGRVERMPRSRFERKARPA